MARVWRPVNLEDALRIRSAEHPLILAGGTDWMIKRERYVSGGGSVLYIGRLPELRHMIRDGNELRIGAACTFSQLLENPMLPDYVKLPLAEAASPAIRNVATIGGNICNASPAADTLPMLYALNAAVCLQSAVDSKWVSIEDFILGPGKTRLGDDQLMTEIRIPLEHAWRCAYRKVGMRRANSLSKLSFYAVAARAAERLLDVRLALGAVAPTVVRCREAEREILSGGNLIDTAVLQKVVSFYDELIRPIDDVRSSSRYRRAVALRLLSDYLTKEMGL